jgi:hypothetical protein
MKMTVDLLKLKTISQLLIKKIGTANKREWTLIKILKIEWILKSVIFTGTAKQ